MGATIDDILAFCGASHQVDNLISIAEMSKNVLKQTSSSKYVDLVLAKLASFEVPINATQLQNYLSIMKLNFILIDQIWFYD